MTVAFGTVPTTDPRPGLQVTRPPLGHSRNSNSKTKLFRRFTPALRAVPAARWFAFASSDILTARDSSCFPEDAVCCALAFFGQSCPSSATTETECDALLAEFPSLSGFSIEDLSSALGNGGCAASTPSTTPDPSVESTPSSTSSRSPSPTTSSGPTSTLRTTSSTPISTSSPTTSSSLPSSSSPTPLPTTTPTPSSTSSSPTPTQSSTPPLNPTSASTSASLQSTSTSQTSSPASDTKPRSTSSLTSTPTESSTRTLSLSMPTYTFLAPWTSSPPTSSVNGLPTNYGVQSTNLSPSSPGTSQTTSNELQILTTTIYIPVDSTPPTLPSSTVPSTIPAAPTSSDPMASSFSAPPSNSSPRPTSLIDTTAAKAGIGGGLGGIALLALILFLFLRCRRRRQTQVVTPYDYSTVPGSPGFNSTEFSVQVKLGLHHRHQPDIRPTSALYPTHRSDFEIAVADEPDNTTLYVPEDRSAVALRERERELEKLYPSRRRGREVSSEVQTVVERGGSEETLPARDEVMPV
ncbi:hypothetical protein F5I97DRAFT_1117965 [Phlebopus sp. FC_14]|nr:hypothetical protein F5I97DRAFT_1117965 [Phlebopus sp. FC_14]